MIKLEVEDYCQECPDFDAEIVKVDKSYADHCYGFNGVKYATVHLHDTTISCKNKRKCAVIEECIKQRMAKEND